MRGIRQSTPAQGAAREEFIRRKENPPILESVQRTIIVVCIATGVSDDWCFANWHRLGKHLLIHLLYVAS